MQPLCKVQLILQLLMMKMCKDMRTYDKIYKEENEMLMDIKNQIYDDSRMEVFNQRFNNLDDGKASKRVVDIIYKAGH
mgnify:CR=1 FL=1